MSLGSTIALIKALGGSGGGSGGGVLVVNIDFQTMALNKTWQEITDSDFSVIIVPNEEHGNSWVIVTLTNYGPDKYFVEGKGLSGDGVTSITFYADTPNDYPVMSN